MSQRPAPRDPRSRLALGCSALARAGQQLSVASAPDQVRSALESVAVQLESDPNLAGLLPVDEIARKCRETARCPDDGALVSGCRLMATSLARRASSLAAEVQQRAREAFDAPDGVAAVPPQAIAQPDRPRPVALEAPALPTPEPTGAPVRGRGVEPASPARASSAPQVSGRFSSQRFTRAGGDAIVDEQTNRMWLAAVLPGMSHAAARSAVAQLGIGGHHDWRIPTLPELQEIMDHGGLQALRGLGVLPGVAAPRLWSSDLRSRFFGLLRSVGVVSAATGETSRCSPRDASIRTLAVRGG